MQFERVLALVCDFLRQNDAAPTVIGGMALMKAHAIENDPSRRFKELADIQYLLSVPGIGRATVKEYFDRCGLSEDFCELEKA